MSEEFYAREHTFDDICFLRTYVRACVRACVRGCMCVSVCVCVFVSLSACVVLREGGSLVE